ncbi:MAG TPA: glycoside hydrolase family 3 N-terminal domain-containing protein, partial [Levilinea sp.]|nr:glycoside hydrolase family 3 N-terminal domain-containing protein [Levilinea sp.]
MWKLLRILQIALLLSIQLALLPMHSASAIGLEQSGDPRQKAQALLARLTPEERVGQLFLVSFQGRSADVGSQVYELVTEYHVGGVMLRADQDNFTGPEDTLSELYGFISQLQTAAAEFRSGAAAPESQYIPLFVGISQEGDGYPHDQIFNGMTPLPNQMAIGATWNLELAREVGEVLGKELEALGINMVIGPSLDVLDLVYVEGGEDLGTRTFGGDPFWVGEMGRSYIQGLHSGSTNRLAVIAKHFPGRGSSDRPPEEEVATVRKSLEQLKLMELAPFFAVTGNARDELERTDGLLLSHIRYQGFQGNIRETTRPVSFDPVAFEQLMALDPLESWRATGGVIVSDDLGSNAVRRFYGPTGQAFEARQVARNAFLAGNDLLYLGDFIATGDPDSFTTIVRTLEFFTQKYREDDVFALRVDTSVERLLTLKYQLYPEFTLDEVIPPTSGLAHIGAGSSVTFRVAQEAATLIDPPADELSASLPRPPDKRDRLVFLTDTLMGRQCSTCRIQSVVPVSALEDAVLRLYGPQAGDQVLQYRLSSYSFENLADLLDGQAFADEEIRLMEEELRAANWIVVSTLNIHKNRNDSNAFRRMLSERADLLRDKRVIVFAFNAPYYLDATDITKLTAYYGMYSKSSAFLDLAARLLFQEATTSGALPVSVVGIGYDLIEATSPDPNQVIPLFLDVVEHEPGPEPTPTIAPALTLEVTPAPSFRVQDILPLRTGVIYDHNQHVVPDGTPVRFTFTTGGESGAIQHVDTVTGGGVARTTFRIQTAGLLEVRVSSEPAMTSELLRMDVSIAEASVIERITPTIPATETPKPTATLTITPPLRMLTPTGVPLPSPSAGSDEWMLSMFLIWGVAAGVFVISRQLSSLRWSLRWSLLVASGGWVAYLIYLSLIWNDTRRWSMQGGMAGLTVAILAGGLLGGLIG